MTRRVQLFILFVLAAILVIAGRPVLADETPGYSLDELERVVPPRGRLQCPRLEMELYRGTTIRYQRPTKIYSGFKPHLQAFEKVVRDVAIEFYGRPPARLVHMGTFNCRRIRNYPDFLSEHALGNAIDVAGFDFGKLPRTGKLPDGAPRWSKGPFKVRMDDHWNAKGKRAIHGRCRRELARRLIAQPKIFRSLLGPAWPGHHNHFHFDMAPWRTVEVFERESGDNRGEAP